MVECSGSCFHDSGVTGPSPLVIVQPEMVLRWHRQGFRLYWTWKSSEQKLGRPLIAPAVRDLIRNMSQTNPLWGAQRIHGELFKLDIHLSQAKVSKYMVRNRKLPSQSWRTFLNNHLPDLVSIDFFTVPTATFRVLYVFLAWSHERRSVLHFAITDHSKAQWTAQQMVEAFLYETALRYGCGIGIGSMGENFSAVLSGWESSRCVRIRDPRGRILMWSASSDQCVGSASTIWSS